MELKFVIPNTEKTFGNLEFAGEDKTEETGANEQMLHLASSLPSFPEDSRNRDIFLIFTFPDAF